MIRLIQELSGLAQGDGHWLVPQFIFKLLLRGPLYQVVV
jgi:hypothetical protein